MAKKAREELIAFNGIDGATGTYLTPPMPVEELAKRAMRPVGSKQHLSELKARKAGQQASFRVLPQFGDGSDLKRVGWGLIFPAGAQPAQVDAILEAMDELVQHRKAQAGARFKIYRGAAGHRTPDGVPETKNEFLVRHGASVGPVDPNIVPYYLLIVADPQSIPYVFQYELDVQYAVGRIYFTTLAEYARYAHSVVESESGSVALRRRAVFFGPAHKGDKATQLSAENLIKPLHEFVNTTSAEAGLGWTAERVEPKEATRKTLQSLLGGGQTPAFLFTASHGMSWPYADARQFNYQGALVCQDWKGPLVEGVGRKHFLAAEDIPDNHSLLGSIVFHFACFGAGTPYWDDFAIADNTDRAALAERPFLSALPTRLLGHPNGGALAVIGHIERAYTYSFSWAELPSQTQAFQSVLFHLMDGKPVGLALDDMNVRYAEIATELAKNLGELKFDPEFITPFDLTFQWTATNDARGYAILGDPAVRLPLAPAAETQDTRPALTFASGRSGVLPVVLSGEALTGLNESERQAAAQASAALEGAAGRSEAAPEGPASGERGTVSRSDDAQAESSAHMATPGGALPVDPQKTAPRQAIQADRPIPAAPPGGTPAPAGQPFANPIDGLAFALDIYTTDRVVSFSAGGVSFNVLDDAKEKVRLVVVNLNEALQNLSERMKQVTAEAATLKITTSVVDDLKNLDPESADRRFITRISLGGDVELFVPRQSEEVDELLLSLHKEMVNQALTNRLEMVKAIAETVASLFGGQKS